MRSLRLDRLAPREQARACFDWVMRQVQLRDRAGDALPPDFVLRRGWGTALERAQIFLAVLQQLGIDGCMLAVPGKPGEPALRYWLPGALIGKEIYLFHETTTGIESKLDPKKFFRIHRSTIVNIEKIKEMHPWFNGDYAVTLKDGTKLTLSSTYRERLKEFRKLAV